jgi:SpoVK/Ycf46/Vps4 family AAA+-type ATPase
VSFIIYGPPGSGKTFVISKFANVLGWPLLNLPGYFIRRGLESIEAVAGEIFDDLMKLDHTVVFFDECDELFRDRSISEATRSILTFATASMLPKLQQLHDARKVIFILGTNYLRNIAPAIRREGRFDMTLLFDRPDFAARKLIAEKAIANSKSYCLSRNENDSADLIASRTLGCMVSQVQDFATSVVKSNNFELKTPSIRDYEEWCLAEGPKEIKVDPTAQLQNATNQMLRRWREVSKSEEPFQFLC